MFSIIIPVYNTELYIRKCLDSVINQTYKDFECIIVADKSSDDSNKIAKEYVKKDNRFKYIYKENTGLANAKNIGVKNATGDYILFLDGDDYIELDLLEVLKKNLNKKIDMVRYQAREIYPDKVVDYNENGFDSVSGIDGFKNIIRYHYIENSWLYVYSMKFWKDNNFKFMDGCVAEDYGLTPYIISKAKSIKSISYIGYNYVQRKNSLMNNNNYQKKIKKMNDMIKQSIYLKNNISDENIRRFINNSLMTFVVKLKYDDYKKYVGKLREMNVFEYYVGYKKLLISINPYYVRKYLWRLL